MSTHIDEQRGAIDFHYTQEETGRIIKVIGVGGGGGNAVSKMYEEGSVSGVTFLLCNTDKQALAKSAVRNKICLGGAGGKGLGAGNRPEVAEAAAKASEEEIRAALTQDDTEMVFITAGMGGGTGTGAAPIIGKIAMEAGKLTIGIVTIPFVFEGRRKILQALKGVKELENNVDAILVVNNQRLIDVYGDLPLNEAFDLADATLSNAAKGISDMVNHPGRINIDFADVNTTLKGGGVAIISSGEGCGENRLADAIENALRSPLLNNNNIRNAKKLLICVYPSMDHPLLTREMEALTNFTNNILDFENIWGYIRETDLSGDRVMVTLLASGFDLETTEESIMGKYVDSNDPFSFSDFVAQRNEEDKMIERYYAQPIGSARANQPLILEIDELDDDEILAIAEDTPACKRDLTAVEKIRSKRAMTKSSPLVAVEQGSPTDSSTEPSAEPGTDEPSSSQTIYF